MDDPVADPTDAADALARGLRTELHRFLDASGARRVLPTLFHVGRPGGRPEERWAVLEDPSYDVGFRADLVARGIDALLLAAPCPWITRGGDLRTTGEDRAWLAATRTAYAWLELSLPGFFVVTRKGWVNLADDDAVPVVPRRRRRRA